MNQGRIWCVVHPTVGLPLFLGSVALTSLAVHTAVMTHTNWMSNYWQGRAGRVVNVPPQTSSNVQSGPGFAMTVTPVAPGTAAAPASFMITVTPNVPAKPVLAATTAVSAKPAPIHTASTN